MSRTVYGRAPPPGSAQPFDKHPRQTSGHAEHMDLSDVWGKPNVPFKTDPADAVSASSRPLPAAWHGDSEYLRTVIEDKIPEGDIFISTIILPMRRVRNTKKIRFDQLVFNPHIVVPGPEETAPPLVTSRLSSKKAYIERYQLGLKVEHGYGETAAGREQWQGGLQQIISATRRFQELRGMAALLRCHNVAYEWQKKHGIAGHDSRSEVTWNSIRELEVWMTGALQKWPNALKLLCGMGKRTMAEYNVNPTALIMTQACDFYTTHARAETLEVIFSGVNSSAQMTKEVNVSVLPDVRMMVFIAKPHAIRADEQNVQLLSRWRRYGSFVTMIEDCSTGKDPYKSADRTIQRYNETWNRHDDLELSWAIQHCRRFNDGDGALSAKHQELVDDLNAKGGVGLFARPIDEEKFFRAHRKQGEGDGGDSDDDDDSKGDDDGDEDMGDSGAVRQPSGAASRTPENKLVDWAIYWTPKGNGEGEYRIVKRFGDIERMFLSNKFLVACGESGRHYFGFDKNWHDTFNDGMQLMAEINAAAPTEAYWKAIQEQPANAEALKGEPKGYVVNLDSLNAFAMFELPERKPGMPAMPFGYANWAGMMYLASKENEIAKNAEGKEISLHWNGWNNQIFARAARFMRCFDQFYIKAQALFPESPYFHPQFRFANDTGDLRTEANESKSAFFNQLFKENGGAIFFKLATFADSTLGDMPPDYASKSLSSADDDMAALLKTKAPGSAGDDEELEPALDPSSGSGGSKPPGPEAKEKDKDKPEPKEKKEEEAGETSPDSYNEKVKKLLPDIKKKVKFEEKSKKTDEALFEATFNQIASAAGKKLGYNFEQLKIFLFKDHKVPGDPDLSKKEKEKEKDVTVPWKKVQELFNGVLLPAIKTLKPKFNKGALKKSDAAKIWLLTPLTHPASTRPLTKPDENPSDLAAISDLESFMFMKPNLAPKKTEKSKAHVWDSVNRFDGNGHLPKWNATFASIRNPMKLPVHYHGTADVVGERYRKTKSSAAGYPMPKRTGAPLSGPAAKRQKSAGLGLPRMTGHKMGGLSFDDDADGSEWGVEATEEAPAVKKARAAEFLDFPGNVLGTAAGGLYNTENMRKRHNEIETEPDHVVRVFLHLFLSEPVNAHVLQRLVKHHIRVPLNFVVANPYVTRKMDSMIMVVPGDRTGATLWGFSRFEVGDDPRIGVTWGSYNVYLASVVWQDKNVQILRDIFMAAYGGGSDTIPFKRPDQFKANGDHGAQTMVFAEPVTQSRFDTAFDLSGKWQASAVGADLMQTVRDNKLHHAAAPYYNLIYNGFNARQENAFTGKFFCTHDKQNSKVHQDWQTRWNRQTSSYVTIPNQGHAGSTYINCNRIRGGMPVVAPLHSDDPTYRGVQLVPSG